MQHFNITIIASVEANMPWSRGRLDSLEADMMERMMTMESGEEERVGGKLIFGQVAHFCFKKKKTNIY